MQLRSYMLKIYEIYFPKKLYKSHTYFIFMGGHYDK